jgi:hypothetical protein
MSRQKKAWKIANRAYNIICDMMEEEDVDVGVGIAVSQLLSGWLRASSDAQITMSMGRLADVPYFGRRNEQDDSRP